MVTMKIKSATITQARARLSELIGKIAHAGQTVVITKRGRPVAKLVPADDLERPHLGKVKGWLEEDDPFFDAVDKIVAGRANHRPRNLRGAGR
jgi:prevent-host-death family protein